jgi:hypothetical protein
MEDYWFMYNDGVICWCQNRDFSTIWGTPGRLSWFCGEFFGQQNENFPRLKGPLHGSRVSFVCFFTEYVAGIVAEEAAQFQGKKIASDGGEMGRKKFRPSPRDFKL